MTSEYSSPAFLREHGPYPSDLEASIARLDAGKVRRASCYVLVIAPEALEALRASDDAALWRKAIVRRAQQKPVLTLSLDPDESSIIVTRIEPNSLAVIDDLQLLEHLRNCELSEIVRLGSQNCLLRAPTGYHLVTPSGLHCSIFLRVANAASCLDELDAMARWLAPEIAKAGVVLADNWNICPPILRAMALAKRQHVSFDFFKGHTRGDRIAARDVVDRALSRKGDGGVLLILSVCGGGTFAADVQRICFEAGYRGSFKALSLYKFRDSNGQAEAMCSLELDAGYAPPEKCEPCKQQSKIISVDPNVYYLREYVEHEVTLQSCHFLEPSKFVSKYLDCTDALAVHRDDPNDGRHHALYIDVFRLLQNAEFEANCRRFIAAYMGEADVAVVPPHQAGRSLGALVAEVLNIPIVKHNNLRPEDGLQADDCALLRAARKVLILDDVLMSGSRFDAYNKALRENPDSFGSFDSVRFLVAIARPVSEIAWRRAEVSLTKHAPWSASLTYIEQVFLPFWGAKQCPWCLEYDFLSSWSSKLGELPNWLHQRLNDLTRKSKGLVSEPLLLLPPAQPATLGVGALAGTPGLSSMRTLFSVMSAIQILRHDRDDQRRLGRSILAANVFKPVNFTNYSEALVRSAILRSLMPPELGQQARAQSGELLVAALAQPDQHLMLGELVFAMYRNALPSVPEGMLMDLMKGRMSEDARLLLREIS